MKNPKQLNDKITNTVVYDQKQGVQQLALELQKKVPILPNEKVPSSQELYNPSVPPRTILVPARKKVSNQNSKQLNEPKPSVSKDATKLKVTDYVPHQVEYPQLWNFLSTTFDRLVLVCNLKLFHCFLTEMGKFV